MSATSALGRCTNKLFGFTIWETPKEKKVTLGILFIY